MYLASFLMDNADVFMNKTSEKIEEVKILLGNIHPECSEKELETMAINLWEISLCLIRIQIKNDIEKIDGKIIKITPKCNSP